MARPLGITILGILVLLAGLFTALIGIAGILAGLAGLLPGSPIPPSLILFGFLFLVLGVILGIAGGGLLRLRPWAWWLATIVTLAALLNSLYGLWANGVDLLGLLGAGFLGLIFFYLLTTYGAFRRPRPLV